MYRRCQVTLTSSPGIISDEQFLSKKVLIKTISFQKLAYQASQKSGPRGECSSCRQV